MHSCRLALVGILAGASGHSGQALADTEVWWDLSVGGGAIAYPQVKGWPDDSQPPAWTLDQTFSGRLNLAWYPDDALELGVHYGLSEQARLTQTESDDSWQQALATAQADFRWRDLDPSLVEDDPVRVSQNLDRAYVRSYSDWGDVTLGRQPISFGLARVYSPVDVILPSGLQAQEPSYRAGVDAVRWLLSLGAVTELDLGWVFGEDFVLFARGYTQVDSVTWELTALTVNQTHHVVGLGTQTALGNWGLWQESALLATDGEDSDSPGFRATLGLDQQLPGDVYVVAEYHFNSLGQAGGYAAPDAGGWYQSGLVSAWGRHYLSLQASKPFSALWQGSLGQAINLSDGGMLLTGAVTRSLGNNSSVDLTFEQTLAESPESVGGTVRVIDEYGVYPSRIQVNWRTVF
jgi:hypothetical protein